jgi:hypothetical protein
MSRHGLPLFDQAREERRRLRAEQERREVKTPAEEARDAGMERVHDHNVDFADEVIRLFPRLSLPETFIAEDFRVAAIAVIGETPPPQVWGPITKRLIAGGLIEEVNGELRKMTSRRSHARRSILYRRVDPSTE